jgi:tetratricopeptide (TPR) repeat protein
MRGRQNLERVASYFQQAVARDGGYAPASAGLASVRIAQADLAAGAWRNLGLHAWDAGRLDEALAAARKALELNPQFPGAHWMLARILRTQGHLDEALAEDQREPEPPWRDQGLAID